MINNIHALLGKEYRMLQTKQSNNDKRIKVMSEFQMSFENLASEDYFTTLSRSKERHESVDAGLKSGAGKLELNKIFANFRREFQVCTIAKAI